MSLIDSFWIVRDLMRGSRQVRFAPDCGSPGASVGFSVVFARSIPYFRRSEVGSGWSVGDPTETTWLVLADARPWGFETAPASLFLKYHPS